MRKTYIRRNRPAVLKPIVMTLVSLAESLWGPLSAAEKILLKEIEGDTAYLPETKKNFSPATRDLSSTSKTVRAGLLRWLCLCRDAAQFIDLKGLRIFQIRIEGKLDLESIICSFPLRIEECVISGGICLNHAKFPYVEIKNTRVDEFKAVRVRLEGSLSLVGLHVKGELSLHGAFIQGNINLDKAKLSSDDCALNLEGATIGGALMMRHGFRCDGYIRIFSAHIGKNIECQGVIVFMFSKVALQIESAKIGGSILLRNGFRSFGQVRIHETILDGTLDLQGARITTRTSAAIFIHGSRIKGSILLRRGDEKYRSRYSGGVRITYSFIDGHLNLSNARIQARGHPAVDMLDTKIEGRLIAQATIIDGEFVLVRSIVKNDVIFSAAQLINPGGKSLSARGIQCGGSFLLGENFSAQGAVVLFGANIGDEFHADGATFENAGGIALDLRESTIKSIVWCKKCRVAGTFDFRGALVGSFIELSRGIFDGDLIFSQMQIGGHLYMHGAKLSENSRLLGDGLRCKGSLFLDEDFNTLGGVYLYNAIIDGDFYSNNSSYGNGGAISLSMNRSRIGGDIFLVASRLNGFVSLEFTSIGGRISFSNTKIFAKFDKISENIALSIKGSLIGGDANFDDGFTARGGLLLDGVRVSGNLSFGNCLVFRRGGNAISLIGATIQGDIDAGTSLSLNARYAETRLLGGIDFRKATIEGDVDLTGMWILNGENISLQGGRMKIKGSLDMRLPFLTNGIIDLHDATVGSYLDDEDGWLRANSLILDGLTYSAIFPAESTGRLRWLKHRLAIKSVPMLSTKLNLVMQPYEQLIQSLKKQGLDRDSRNIAIAKQAYIAEYGIKNWWGRIMHKFYGVTMKFGYRPQRVLRFAPIFLCAFCVILYSGANGLMIPVYSKSVNSLQNINSPYDHPSFNGIAYAIETFIPGLNLQQKEFWRPDDHAICSLGPRHCGFWLRIYLWFHMAVGGIITALAAAGFAGLVRKD